VPGADFRFAGGNEKLTASCFKAAIFSQAKTNRKKLPAINLRLKRCLLYGKRQATLNMVRKIALNSVKRYKEKTARKRPLSKIMFDYLLDHTDLLPVLRLDKN
jgi:hypothetical protein